MKFSMSGDILRKIVGDNGSECYVCGSKENLTTCKACNLTKCKDDCMSNEDLCEDCMCELIEEGEFNVYVSREFETEMYNKYVKDRY